MICIEHRFNGLRTPEFNKEKTAAELLLTRSHIKVGRNPCTYYHAWKRFLSRAGVRYAGTQAIRHRAATEIANSAVDMKDGMAMTGHKTVEMFLRYVHPDEKRLRKSVEKVSAQRRKLANRCRPLAGTAFEAEIEAPPDTGAASSESKAAAVDELS